MTFKECKYLIKSDLNRLTKDKWGGGKIPKPEAFRRVINLRGHTPYEKEYNL